MSAARRKPASKATRAVKRASPARPASLARDFTALVDDVRRVHEECAAAASRTINTMLTLRNWTIGCYIRTYEQSGADRARYGAHLLERLSESLQGCLDRCYTGRYLGLCRSCSTSTRPFGSR
jgi:hypothetical protein